MGRNKKKSKAAAHAASESDEEKDETHEAAAVATTTPRGDGGGEKDTANKEEAAEQHSGHDSEHDGSDSEDAPKKKKEYKGNRFKKQEQKKKKGKGNDNAAAAASGATAEVGGDGEQEGDAAAPKDTRVPPVEVLYCPNCTFPAEYCEFGGMMDKCRPWLLEHAAELAEAEDRGRKRRILTEKERLEALLEGRGIKKALSREVVIEVERRTGRRMITSVFGMDLFGFNLKDLSREWRKRFSCGAGVRVAEEGKHQDCIDVQGDVADKLAEMMCSEYQIPKEAVFTMISRKKVPYPY